jgi:hypothetical protein
MRSGIPPTIVAKAILAVALISGLNSQPCSAQEAPERSSRGFVLSVGLSDEQNVFRLEAAHAARVLSAQFGHGGTARVRPTEDLPSIPMPSMLATLLAQTASQMDKQHDVLIVFLTSHGSPQGLAVKSGKRMGTLAPRQLRNMLDATGVERKVLIVSACYSGVFAGLANRKTAVITAADAVSPSFGCTATAKLTYFGAAFLGSIPETPTLPAAFQKALPRIEQLEDKLCSGDKKISDAQRRRLVEQRKCFRRSNPQMSGGQEFVENWRATNVKAGVGNKN